MSERENDRLPKAQRALMSWLSRHCVGTWTFSEFSGSLGDLGTFLPLVVALAATIQLDLGTTLLFTGLYNILSGVIFRIPMCVQPMKTIAAVALASKGMSIMEAMSAGIFVSGTMLFLGITGLMNLFNSLIPNSIVRGIQLAVGLQLAKKGITQAFLVDTHSTAGHVWRPMWGIEGVILGLTAITFLLLTTIPAAVEGEIEDSKSRQQQQQHDVEQQQEANQDREAHQQQQQQQHTDAAALQDTSPADHCSSSSSAAAAACCSGSSSSSRAPAALIIVLIGLILSPISNPSALSHLTLGPVIPTFQIPTLDQFKNGILKAGLAQLPLTSLNSVIAVSQLAGELFPAKVAADGWRWRPGVVAISVGMMNMIGCWWGAFPCCHGSGGLAAQYKFGARTGAACIILGLIKITLALLFGSSLLPLLQHFPGPLLGSMLLMAGIELATSARKAQGARSYCFMLLTAVAILGLGDTAIGFVLGLGAYGAVAAYEKGVGNVRAAIMRRYSNSSSSTAAGGSDSHNGVIYSRLEVNSTH